VPSDVKYLIVASTSKVFGDVNANMQCQITSVSSLTTILCYRDNDERIWHGSRLV